MAVSVIMPNMAHFISREDDPEGLYDPMCTLFVGDLSYFCAEDDLKALFSFYGKVLRVVVRRARDGYSLMHGFVTLNSNEAARRAVQKVDGSVFMGRNIRLQLACEGYRAPESKDHLIEVHVSFTGSQDKLCSESFLRDLFQQYGEIGDVCIRKHGYVNAQAAGLGNSKSVVYHTMPSYVNHIQQGYAFVYFVRLEDALAGIEAYHGQTVCGLLLDCSVSHKTELLLQTNYEVISHTHHGSQPVKAFSAVPRSALQAYKSMLRRKKGGAEGYPSHSSGSGMMGMGGGGYGDYVSYHDAPRYGGMGYGNYPSQQSAMGHPQPVPVMYPRQPQPQVMAQYGGGHGGSNNAFMQGQGYNQGQGMMPRPPPYSTAGPRYGAASMMSIGNASGSANTGYGGGMMNMRGGAYATAPMNMNMSVPRQAGNAPWDSASISQQQPSLGGIDFALGVTNNGEGFPRFAAPAGNMFGELEPQSRSSSSVTMVSRLAAAYTADLTSTASPQSSPSASGGLAAERLSNEESAFDLTALSSALPLTGSIPSDTKDWDFFAPAPAAVGDITLSNGSEEETVVYDAAPTTFGSLRTTTEK